MDHHTPAVYPFVWCYDSVKHGGQVNDSTGKKRKGRRKNQLTTRKYDINFTNGLIHVYELSDELGSIQIIYYTIK